ncbi:Proteoglycan-4 [Mycoblastus sanguinarius]|nr:Proteoglycan-4 [Mycoblastus sanguinarius]
MEYPNIIDLVSEDEEQSAKPAIPNSNAQSRASIPAKAAVNDHTTAISSHPRSTSPSSLSSHRPQLCRNRAQSAPRTVGPKGVSAAILRSTAATKSKRRRHSCITKFLVNQDAGYQSTIPIIQPASSPDQESQLHNLPALPKSSPVKCPRKRSEVSHPLALPSTWPVFALNEEKAVGSQPDVSNNSLGISPSEHSKTITEASPCGTQPDSIPTERNEAVSQPGVPKNPQATAKSATASKQPTPPRLRLVSKSNKQNEAGCQPTFSHNFPDGSLSVRKRKLPDADNQQPSKHMRPAPVTLTPASGQAASSTSNPFLWSIPAYRESSASNTPNPEKPLSTAFTSPQSPALLPTAEPTKPASYKQLASSTPKTPVNPTPRQRNRPWTLAELFKFEDALERSFNFLGYAAQNNRTKMEVHDLYNCLVTTPIHEFGEGDASAQKTRMKQFNADKRAREKMREKVLKEVNKRNAAKGKGKGKSQGLLQGALGGK